MDAAINLAQNTFNTAYEDLPKESIQAAKLVILDTLATALGGSTTPGSKEVVGLVTDWGGKEESTIIGYGTKVTAHSAALANGTMAHALDYDDTHDQASLHTGVCIIPACLAVAEKIGGISGKQFITAVTLGIDIMCRIGLATPTTPVQSGWLYTPLYGYLGAAAAAAKLLDMDVHGILNAMGIAYGQSAGNCQCIKDGALTKRIQAGFAAQGGVISAQMAQAGITGAKNILEGQYGLFNVYHQSKYDREPLIADLGTRFEVSNLSFKPYPCGRWSHAPIDGILSIIRKNKINHREIEKIDVWVCQALMDMCQPLEDKRRPKTTVDAQFSVPYTMAVAAVKDRVGIDDLTGNAIYNPEVLSMASRIQPQLAPEFNKLGPGVVKVSVQTRSGNYDTQITVPKGHPDNPLTKAEFVDKLTDCSRYAPKPFSEKTISNIVNLITSLEKSKDVRQIAELIG